MKKETKKKKKKKKKRKKKKKKKKNELEISSDKIFRWTKGTTFFMGDENFVR